MPTAAQRAEAAAAAKPKGGGGGGSPATTKGDRHGDLPAMTDMELRTEAKRLLGAEYDHSIDDDRDALTDAIIAARDDRAAYYAQQRKARREALAAAAEGDD